MQPPPPRAAASAALSCAASSRLHCLVQSDQVRRYCEWCTQPAAAQPPPLESGMLLGVAEVGERMDKDSRHLTLALLHMHGCWRFFSGMSALHLRADSRLCCRWGRPALTVMHCYDLHTE